MPTQRFALEPGAPKRLFIISSWGGKYTVQLDGAALATIATKELKKGAAVALPDGSRLDLKLETMVLTPVVTVSRNGVALPGSASDPLTQVKGAATALYAVAGLTAVIGVLMASGSFAKDQGGEAVSMGVGMLAAAAIYAVLGFFTSRRSIVAVSIGIVLFIVDSFVTFAESASAFGTPNVWQILVRIALVIFMVRGAQGMWKLRKEARGQPAVG